MKSKLMSSKLLFPTLLTHRSGSLLRPTFIFCLLSFTFFNLKSQVPQGFNYQAVATDGNGSALANKDIQIKFGILSDTVTPVVVWEELHSSVRTNSVGLFNLVIGTGERQSGVATFSDIKWSGDPLFIRIKLNYLGVWRTMGSSRLWTVPYAMAAGSLSGPISKLDVSGDESSPDSALFEVRNINGQLVFAVYNEGVRVYVDDGVKSQTKGGFAIGGFSTAKTGSQDLFVVSPDSIRAYIGTNPAKGVKGGFAIGGFNTVKALPEEYMRVTRDSTRINISEPSKSFTGGFAIGSLSTMAANNLNYVNFSRDNYFIGFEAGTGITTGKYNAAFGYQAGKMNKDGSSNVFIGWSAGINNISGSNNVFIGRETGLVNSGTGNVFIGYQAGSAETGSDKLYIGNSSTHPPLMWGDFANGKIAINSTDTQGFTFYINGSGSSLIPWGTASDIRLKENIQTITDALSKVLNLRGVTFNWKDRQLTGDKMQMGFIAQETEKIIPEVVVKGNNYLFIQYAPITALLVEAVKEQQKVIEEQRERIEKLEHQQARLDELEKLVNSLKSGNN